MPSMKLFNGCLTVDEAGKLTVTSAAIGSLAGILKGSAGDIAAAEADTDYQQPVTWGDGLAYSGGTAGVDHTTNLKITSEQLDTVQDIGSANSPTFANVSSSNAPSSAAHLTRKDYVDALIQGLKPKDNCVVATTENITLSGEQTIDGVLTDADRVLVWQQSDAKENGIYVSGDGAWTRSSDADTGVEVLGAFTKILQGATYGGDQFVDTNSSAPEIGVDDITFADWGTTTNHNSLQGLQGGTTDEYFHLTNAQHTVATQAATGSLAGYLASADWATFNGKEDVLSAGNGLERSGDTLAVDHNTTNLKITAGEINTIQDIAPASDVSFNKATIATTIVHNNLTANRNSQALADDAEITIEAGTVGFGTVQAGDNEEWANFSWSSAGAVTLISSSDNVANTDADAKLCIYDAGSGPKIKNRLGASKTVRYLLNYS